MASASGKPQHPKSCHERALGLLAVRARSRRELERRLLQAGFGLDEVEHVLARLEGVGLVDDRAFARQLADHAFGVKHSGVRAVAGSLAAAGVAREIIAETVDPHAGDEEARAGALAGSRASRMRSIDPQKAYSRLVSLLMRRGFGADVARAAARRALALDIADDGPSLASRTERP